MIRTLATLLGTIALAGCGGATTMHLGDTDNGSGGSSSGAGGQATGSGGQATGGSTSVGTGGTDVTMAADAGMASCALNAGQSGPLAMTNFEYDNTVHELLGYASAPSKAFVLDPPVAGFLAEPEPVSMLRTSQYVSAASTLSLMAEGALAQGNFGILPCSPATVDQDACAGQFIATFGKRAFRRPLTAAETAEMQQIYAKDKGANDFIHAIRVVIESMLSSPRFYEIEPKGAAPGLAALDPYRLASRLSYFIWRSMPDDQLFAAAEGGKLVTKADVEAQARRMLADARAHAGVIDFFSEWLGLDRLGSVVKDTAAYPNFAALSKDMATETTKFVESIFFGDGRLQSLMQSSNTWVNQPLADLYAQPGVVGSTFQQVQLNPKLRAGILTQASFLSLTGSATAGSPTRRGMFVREKLLCQAIPPPPANVNLTLMDPAPGQTNRERYAASIGAGGPACAGCHQLMDPIGYGFEEFDAVGRYRTTDNGSPVDASGNLTNVDGVEGAFTGAVELASKLASSAVVRECTAKQWFRFALSRAEAEEDACSLSAATQTLTTSGRLPELVIAIATSDSFRYARW